VALSNKHPQPGQIYRHFKGGRYEVALIATDSETDADMVIYRDLATGRYFVRSVEMFMSPKVYENGQKVERFVLEIGDGQEKGQGERAIET
jgi:hypothetical protein